MLILSIDTSTKSSSVALHQAGKLLALSEFFAERTASHSLTVAIEQIIRNSGLSPQDLQAVAVSKGPGSYTGLRVGVAAAKGLCYALGKPLIAIDTLEIMAFGAKDFYPDGDHYLCPVIDARRMEVFCALYDQDLNVIAPVAAIIIDQNSFSDILVGKKIVFMGDGAAKCENKLVTRMGSVFLKQYNPSARFLGQLAWNRFQNSIFENVQTFEPFYLKEFLRYC